MEDSEKNTLMESHSMDSEGIQDPEMWCDTSRVETIPTPIDESIELLESCNMNDGVSWDSFLKSNSLNPTMSNVSEMSDDNSVVLPINCDVEVQDELVGNFVNDNYALSPNWNDLEIQVMDDIKIDKEHDCEDNQDDNKINPQNSHFEASLILTSPDTSKSLSHKKENSSTDSDDSSRRYSLRKSTIERRRKSGVSYDLLKFSTTLAHPSNPIKRGRLRKSCLNSPSSSTHTVGYTLKSKMKKNKASRKYRLNMKVKQSVMQETVEELIKKNNELRMKIRMLEVKIKQMNYLLLKPF